HHVDVRGDDRRLDMILHELHRGGVRCFWAVLTVFEEESDRDARGLCVLDAELDPLPERVALHRELAGKMQNRAQAQLLGACRRQEGECEEDLKRCFHRVLYPKERSSVSRDLPHPNMFPKTSLQPGE